MKQERPVRPDDVHSLADQLRNAFRSAETNVPVEFADNVLRLDRVSSTEFALWAPGAPEAARVLLCADPETLAYPEDLPHLPGEVVILTGAGPTLTATWWSRTDSGELMTEIDRQTVASGWERQLGDTFLPPGVVRHTYRKADQLRVVMATQGMLSLHRQP
jgi:hypothetical protein